MNYAKMTIKELLMEKVALNKDKTAHKKELAEVEYQLELRLIA